MHLKNLTVLGFKSFADKTSLAFQPGITAVVGPNGCGKSNVADSLRWVLGEQSAKALRGGEMADVIFNGTDNRKPLGMAEVSLTISDIDQDHLRAAGINLDYNEVTITRRVFRDGGSEYFINKTACRLKDIQQLFMGTGMGRTSYSIMAQGHITQLLSSRPDDRRIVFEEAAGITRFKSQKKEALRKLENTEQNLLRVSDLIREVKRQIGSLQRQAGKARRYKQLMIELQHLDTQLARHQFDVLEAEIKERQALSDKLRIEIELCSEAALREEDEVVMLRQQLTALEHEVGETQKKGLELKGQADFHQNRIQFNQERLLELEQQNATTLQEIAQSEERLATAQGALAEITEKLACAQATLDEKRRSLDSKRQELQSIEEGLRQRQEALRRAQSEAFSIAQRTTRIRNELTALEMQKQGNAVRLDKLSSEKIQLEEERARLEQRLAESTSSVENEKLAAQNQRQTAEQKQARVREIQQQLAQTTREMDELLRQQAGGRSRLNVLEQLQSEHEGFGAGALAALKQAPQMLGALVDHLQVPDEYIQPLEAALGRHLQLICTDEPETARKVLDDLKAKRLGKASIAALGLQPAKNQPTAASVDGAVISTSTPASPEGQDGNLAGKDAPPSLDPLLPQSCETTGTADSPSLVPTQVMPAQESTEQAQCPLPVPISLLSVIQADAKVRPLLGNLLDGMMVVPDLQAALAHWQQSKGARSFVTLTGEILDACGIFTGGSAQGNEKTAASILGRKNQIRELQSQLARLQEQINEFSRQKGALQSELTSLQASLQQVQTDLRTQEMAIATRQGECKALENALRLLHQKVDTVVYEVQNLASQEKENLQKRQAIEAQATQLSSQEARVQEEIAHFTGELEDLRQQRDVSFNAQAEARAALATEEQVVVSSRQQEQNLQQRIRELNHFIAQRKGEITSLISRRDQLQAEIEASRMKIEAIEHDREMVNARAAELAGRKNDQETDIAAREETLRERRHRLTEMQQRRGGLDVELAQKNMSVQHLRERIQQKYQVNLDEVRSECITITIADEGPPKIETLSPEDMAQRGLSTNWDNVAEQVAALQKRVDDIGPVNLVAIEEYEETEQRHQFLSSQFEDLTKAKEQLLDVINRINTQTKEMFTETFNKVRENFGQLFTEIFGGGKADLILVNEGDVLESGIDILARPPGKQLRSITLLSGGEQTMTAVALLFAIYQVKPSPFCVLDELDAPLDESNINRFIKILKRFLVHSQFIIITHNKRTISTADVIYGVTMQETGVSKLVSMKFHRTEDEPVPQNGDNGFIKGDNGNGSPTPQDGNGSTDEKALAGNGHSEAKDQEINRLAPPQLSGNTEAAADTASLPASTEPEVVTAK